MEYMLKDYGVVRHIPQDVVDEIPDGAVVVVPKFMLASAVKSYLARKGKNVQVRYVWQDSPKVLPDSQKF